jgi:hypothetical protein
MLWIYELCEFIRYKVKAPLWKPDSAEDISSEQNLSTSVSTSIKWEWQTLPQRYRDTTVRF